MEGMRKRPPSAAELTGAKPPQPPAADGSHGGGGIRRPRPLEMTTRPAQPAVDSGELSPGDFRDRVIALLGRPNLPEALAERVKKSDAAHALAQVSTWTAANPSARPFSRQRCLT